jgi:transposase
LRSSRRGFFNFFNEDDVEVAWKAFDEIGDWVEELGYPPLIRWWQNLERNWDTLKNFFSFKVTTALSEGINNVIKSIKRQAYGFRNMDYFRLKIMQRCGYLNSQHIPSLDFC